MLQESTTTSIKIQSGNDTDSQKGNNCQIDNLTHKEIDLIKGKITKIKSLTKKSKLINLI